MRSTRADACDRFLPSTASISSTRASFALDEIASRAYGLLRLPYSPPTLEELPPVGWTIEHPAVSRRRGGSGLEPVSCLSRRLDEPVCESLRRDPLIETAPRALFSRVREDSTKVRSGMTSVERCSSSTCVLRHPPRCTGMDPIPRPCLAFGGFAATVPRTTPLHRDDVVLLCANTIVSA